MKKSIQEKTKQETICPACGVPFKGKSGKTCNKKCEQYMIDTFLSEPKAKYHATIHSNKALILPIGLLTELAWISGDLLQLEKSEVSEEDENSYSKLIISNLTKNKEDKESSSEIYTKNQTKEK